MRRERKGWLGGKVGYRALDLYFWAGRLRDRLFTVALRSGFSSFGENSLLSLPVRMGGMRRIRIGDRVHIGPNCWIECFGGDRVVPDVMIAIGGGTSISGFCSITAVREVIIEEKVLIARNVHISDHSHCFEDVTVPIMDQGIGKSAPVRIREGAWLGHGCVVCPGVTIGRNAVIGANSVVRDDVPDFCVAAGAPARVVRRVKAE